MHGTQATINQTLAAAVTHHRAGRLDDAERIYRQVLAVVPNQPHALYLLGTLKGQRGQSDAAVELIGRAISLAPERALYHSNLGECLRMAGKPGPAVAACQRAIAIQPGLVMAHNNLGSALRDHGRLDEAAAAYLGALRLGPDCVPAHTNLANVRQDQGRIDEAMRLYQSALRLAPNSPEAHCNLGSALRGVGRQDEAIAEYRCTIRLKAGHFEAWNNLGVALVDRTEFTEALSAYRKAIALKSDYAEAHQNLALSLLSVGDYQAGFLESEWRWQCKGRPRPRRLPGSRWEGEPLHGRTIMLYAEEGLGDALQFVRFAPLVAALGGPVVLECQPELLRLLQRQGLPGVCQVIGAGKPIPPVDLHCPLMSAPLCMGTTLDSIPDQAALLAADAELVDAWRSKIGPGDGRLQVGLCWAGNPAQANDRNRSMHPRHLAALADVPGVRFHDLQKVKSADPDRLPPPALQLEDHTADLADMADTSALIAHLDLVITVDTSVAHLAGAMGKEVWVLLAFCPDWRYFPAGPVNRWYPAMRQFRQPRQGDWRGVMAMVSEALEARAGGQSDR